MTSGPGTTGKTDVPPDEAIEEISGLLEMDEVNAGGSKTADGSGEPEADVAHAATSDVSHELEVSLETPSPVQLESYLLPPPVADEPRVDKRRSGVRLGHQHGLRGSAREAGSASTVSRSRRERGG